jgi:hypothetical protein
MSSKETITTLDCVLLKDNNRALVASLGPEIRRGLNEVFALVLCLSRNVGDFQSMLYNIPEEPLRTCEDIWM